MEYDYCATHGNYVANTIRRCPSCFIEENIYKTPCPSCAALRADQQDWRKGVALIASSLGEKDPSNLCCVRISEIALTLRAEVERLREAVEWACNSLGERIKKEWWVEQYVAELRRRAKKKE